MNKNKDPRFRLIILVLVLLNVIVVREGYLLSEKLYFILFVSVPALFYLLLGNDNKRVRDQSSNYPAPAKQEKLREIAG